MKAVTEYIEDEDFDTDAIMQDIEDVIDINEKNESNILQLIEIDSLCKRIKHYVCASNAMAEVICFVETDG